MERLFPWREVFEIPAAQRLSQATYRVQRPTFMLFSCMNLARP